MPAELRPSGPADLRAQVALVTGGARGIGRAVASALARSGAAVAVADLLATAEAEAEIAAAGRRALGLALDVTDAGAVRAAVERTVRTLGRLDILVTAAGVIHRDGLEETSEATWARVLDVVLTGTFHAVQAVVPVMRAQGYGKIVTISSISGIIGGAVSRPADNPDVRRGRSGPAYAAAKGGVIALTRWIAKDVGQSGIYVNSVAPGGIDTEMTRGFAYTAEALPIPRMGRAEDVAEAVLFLASPASNYVTGQVLRVDGGWVIG
jgi:3-oxoacyl-[acyl-carrier protein] reductase